jgi:hypothetical protein
MSKPRLKLLAVIDTESHADTIIAAIRAEIVGKDVFEEHSSSRGLNEAGQVELTFDFRFNSGVDRDAVRTWLKDQVKDHPVVKTWVQSVKLTRHECSHDSITVVDCKTTNYVVDFER